MKKKIYLHEKKIATSCREVYLRCLTGVEMTIKTMTLDALLLQKTFYFKVEISKNKPQNK